MNYSSSSQLFDLGFRIVLITIPISQQSSTRNQHPVASIQYPEANSQKPVSSSQQPETSNENPPFITGATEYQYFYLDLIFRF